MSDTPILHLPYPVDADTVDVPRDLQALAERLEVLLGDLSVAGVVVPVGTIVATGRLTAPAGWILCLGQTVSRTNPLYVALFAAIGTWYGAGDGSTTFVLPNLGGRVPVGAGTAVGEPGATSHGLGQTDGAETVVLTNSNLPGTVAVQPSGGAISREIDFTPNPAADVYVALGGSPWSLGTNQAHENMQPYQVVNFMVKL